MAASHALAMGPALLRRFCSCELERACTCDAEPSLSGWSVEALTELWELMRLHGSAATAAHLMRRTLRDCNVALDALLGATPTHALARLEAQAAKNLRTPRRFLAVHGMSGEQSRAEAGTAA